MSFLGIGLFLLAFIAAVWLAVKDDNPGEKIAEMKAKLADWKEGKKPAMSSAAFIITRVFIPFLVILAFSGFVVSLFVEYDSEYGYTLSAVLASGISLGLYWYIEQKNSLQYQAIKCGWVFEKSRISFSTDPVEIKEYRYGNVLAETLSISRRVFIVTPKAPDKNRPLVFPSFEAAKQWANEYGRTGEIYNQIYKRAIENDKEK